ncbi:MAG TPA: tetratricopeptide repeat-containing sensor histidine kinase [Chitinophagaceae bacterium]|nr:tetratricopeptide repeat-containing sensor histidine kinase [Chitinophagaceae bacterium]
MKSTAALFLCLCMLSVFSQKHGPALIDSLLEEVKVAKADSDKVRLYIKISDIYIDVDIEKAFLFADSAAAVSQKNSWQEGISLSKLNYGNVYNFSGAYTKAIENAAKAYDFFKEKDDKKNTGSALYIIGVANERLGNYSVAAEKYFGALRIFEAIPGAHRLTGNSLSAIAVIYFLQRDYEKSLTYSFKALAKQEVANNTPGIANEYVAIADTYDELGDSANALKYNLKALEMQQKVGSKFGEALIYFQLGKLYKNDYKKALDYHFKAEALFSQLSDNSNFSTFNRGEMGRVLFKMAAQSSDEIRIPATLKIPKDKNALLQLAETYLIKAIQVSRQTGDKDNESSFLADLAELEAYGGDYKNAYLNFRAFHQMQDSIYSQKSKNKIAALESQKELDLKNKTIENKELELSNQQKKMWLLTIGLGFLLITGSLVFYQSRLRKKTNTHLQELNAKLNEANKVKAKFFAILSHDLRSPVANLVNFIRLQKREPQLLSVQQAEEREETIVGSAENVLQTMESMLLWSKEQMENFQPQLTTVSVDELFSYLQKAFKNTGDISISYQDNFQLAVITDENYLQTIMYNLTANSIKALKNTTNPCIQWKAYSHEGATVLCISDNGPGISEELIKVIRSETNAVNAKTGFGLHLIRDLARAINCSIRVESVNGKGTTFYLNC